jgi:hypothetical protein
MVFAQPDRLPRAFAVLAALVLASLVARPAAAASKVKIAAIGDPAPGDGVFAGPSFTGWPSAAGTGWIAFRGQVSGGKTSETIVARQISPARTAEVASLGQAAPGGGTFKRFLGRPAVNGRGDVAFFALVNGTKVDDNGPTPAGLFIYLGSRGTLDVIALSRQTTDAGVLDLAAPLDASTDPNDLDVPERTPAIDDFGDVAFLSGVGGGGSAIFFACSGSSPVPIVRVGDVFDGDRVSHLGPPALNVTTLAFHAILATFGVDDENGLRHGILASTVGKIDAAQNHACASPGPLDILVDEASGIAPFPVNQPLTAIEDTIAMNDRGDIAFLGGPAVDPNSSADSTLDAVSGVLVYSTHMVRYVAYPGLAIPGNGTYTDSVLPSSANSRTAPPAISADGRVIYYASLNGGTSGAYVRSDDPPTPLVVLGGVNADPAPTGGLYATAQSAPAVFTVSDDSAPNDATGLVFLARVSSGSTSEAVFAQAGKKESAVIVGEATPGDGFFAGPPFGAPVLNDAGEVVFRAFVAKGPSSVGIFRSRAGRLEAVVRTGDPEPGGATFFDLVGKPSVNNSGAVAFAATIAGKGTGIFVIGANGAKKIVLRGDQGPGGAVFRAIGINPAINDAGVVAFRATVSYPDKSKQEAIWLAGNFGLRAVVASGAPSPSGLPFFKLRDPVITNAPSVGFAAALGATSVTSNGLFLADLNRITTVAIDGQNLDDGLRLTSVSGSPAVDAAGNVAILGRRSGPPAAGTTLRRDLGFAIMTRSGTHLPLVIAQDMPGPAGGTFKSFGAPALGGNGDVAFFGSFNPKNPAAAGFFLRTKAGIEPFLLVGEPSPIGTRFQSFGTRAALNAQDELAFTANVSRGDARTGIFLASPTRTAAGVSIGLSGGRARDHVKVRAVMRLGRFNNGVDPAHELVVLTLVEGGGRTIWTSTVSSGSLRRAGKRFLPDVKGGHPLPRQLRGLRVSVQKDTVHIAATSPSLDLTNAGSLPVKSPVTLLVQVGDDGGAVIVPCRIGRRGGRCG